MFNRTILVVVVVMRKGISETNREEGGREKGR